MIGDCAGNPGEPGDCAGSPDPEVWRFGGFVVFYFVAGLVFSLVLSFSSILLFMVTWRWQLAVATVITMPGANQQGTVPLPSHSGELEEVEVRGIFWSSPVARQVDMSKSLLLFC